MSRALSLDLTVRVLAAVEAGAAHREAGERFGVSPAKRQPVEGEETGGRRTSPQVLER